MGDPLERYNKMLETAAENLRAHGRNNPSTAPVSDPEWAKWIREYKRLGEKLLDAQIAYIRAKAMNEQGVLDDRRFR